ncbi:hypothetical protein EVAR_19287_1 [Eumeta japonica]|uniref:Uncharacterized protein n=1 Tax=Eumeta variegata TaxID=151549 RepID=A0A4C1UEL5_EUMVA|nr:hypothetical protein EVAR_19287_1 [Eumeta japonica]
MYRRHENGYALTRARRVRRRAVRARVVSDHGRVGGYCKSCGADRRGRYGSNGPDTLSFRRPGPEDARAARCSDVIGSRLKGVW